MTPSTKSQPKASRTISGTPVAVNLDGSVTGGPTYSDPTTGTVVCPLPVDHDSLAKAIRRSIGHEDMRSEDAQTIAAHVLNFFGFNERIIDNVLEPDDRDTFYMLEDSGILQTERDETTLYDGREWRIHYWMIRRERIVELAREETQAMAAAGERDVVYSTHLNRSSYPMVLPHGETGTGLAAHAVYHELTDEVWHDHEPGASESEDEVAAPPADRIPGRAAK